MDDNKQELPPSVTVSWKWIGLVWFTIIAAVDDCLTTSGNPVLEYETIANEQCDLMESFSS